MQKDLKKISNLERKLELFYLKPQNKETRSDLIQLIGNLRKEISEETHPIQNFSILDRSQPSLHSLNSPKKNLNLEKVSLKRARK